MFTPEQKSQLEAPLDRKHVASRSQAGRSLSYLEGWHVIAEANRIFGFDGWDRETVELRRLGEPYQTPSRNGGDPTWRVGYMAKVRIKVRSTEYILAGDDPRELPLVVREGCGFGSGIDRDLGQAHESALKEAETDAMKRALMTFGNPFGLALYDKTQANVADAEKPAPTPRPAPARAIPAEIGRSPDAPHGMEQKMADGLIAAGRTAQSEEELDAWKAEPNVKSTFRDLSDAEQNRVTNALAQHRQSLKARAAA
jgi:DNA repair and recombination protein RAD52